MRIAPAMLAGRVAPATLVILASLLVASFATFAAPPAPVLAGHHHGHRGHCTSWHSKSEPPETIRVYRVREGKVDEVDFKDYVGRVASREWNVEQRELRLAGIVAVKQYAWFYVLHYRGGKFNGQCYDVKDSTADQLYAHKHVPRRIRSGVNETWSWRIIRDGQLPMTGYRRGGRHAGCGGNGGYRLYVRSARHCANQGWTAQQILEKYYSGVVVTDKTPE